jgi:hypothetical protein
MKPGIGKPERGERVVGRVIHDEGSTHWIPIMGIFRRVSGPNPCCPSSRLRTLSWYFSYSLLKSEVLLNSKVKRSFHETGKHVLLDPHPHPCGSGITGSSRCRSSRSLYAARGIGI